MQKLSRLAGLAATAFLLAASLAQAMPINPEGTGVGQGLNKSQQGYYKCMNWCDAHNKTAASRNKCYDQCLVYWGGHTG